MISDETLRGKYWDHIKQIIPIQQNAGGCMICGENFVII